MPGDLQQHLQLLGPQEKRAGKIVVGRPLVTSDEPDQPRRCIARRAPHTRIIYEVVGGSQSEKNAYHLVTGRIVHPYPGWIRVDGIRRFFTLDTGGPRGIGRDNAAREAVIAGYVE